MFSFIKYSNQEMYSILDMKSGYMRRGMYTIRSLLS